MLSILIATAFASGMSLVESFEAAAFEAQQAAGTGKFLDALQKAKFRCTADVPDCSEVIGRIEALDVQTRTAAAATPAPAPDAPSGYDDASPPPPQAVWDPYEYYVSMSRPAPGSGFHGYEVLPASLVSRWAQVMCVWKEDAPLPVSGDMIFSLHGRQFHCAGAALPPGPFYVPDDTVIYLAKWQGKRDINGQKVFDVLEVRSCGTNTSTEDVYRKTVLACPVHDSL